MITVPAVFGQFAGRDSHGGAFLLEIPTVSGLVDTGTATLYLSTKEFDLTTDGLHAYGIVREFGPIRHAIDVYSHRYEVSNVTITMSKVHAFKEALSSRTTDYWIGVDYLLRKNWGKEANIYWYPGGDANELADCLTIFTGKITGMSADVGETFTLTLDERETIAHRVLPQNHYNTTDFPDIENELVGAPVPIVYGNWSYATGAGGGVLRQTGFVVADKISTGDDLKYLVAGHAVDTITQIWMYLQSLDSWAYIVTGFSSNVADTEGATITIDRDTMYFIVFMRPFNGYLASTGSDGSNPLGPAAAWDDDQDTKVSVIANSTTEAIIYFEWNQQGSESNDAVENGVAQLFDPAGPTSNVEGAEFWVSKPGGITWTTANVELWNGASWLTIATSMTVDAMTYYDFGTGSPNTYDWISNAVGTFWHLGSGPRGGDGTPFKMRLRFVGSGWTANTTVVAYVHEARLRIAGQYPKQRGRRRGWVRVWTDPKHPERYIEKWGWIDFLELISRNDAFSTIAVECGGREYGSWIDDGARSNSFNAGDAINGPVFQIESILRDELGLGDSNIDVASFDAAEAIEDQDCFLSMRAGSEVNSKDLIETICYEHGFFTYRTHAGKIKIIDYLTGTGETVGTLIPSDLVNQLPLIRLGEYSQLANALTVHHTRLADDNSFARSNDYTDSSSDTAYGTLPITMSLETVKVGSTAAIGDRFKERLITQEYLLSRPHRFVTLETIGNKWAHGELGDVFNLDATFFDPICMCMGDSWLNLDLMIISKEMTERGVTFDTIIWAAPTL